MIEEASKHPRVYFTKSGIKDVVTKSDRKVEAFLIDGIKKHYPDHKFIAEEYSAENDIPNKLTDAPTWVIDPIDGTMNFVHGFPFFSVSVGFMINKITELAIIFNPFLGQFYTARRGKGSYCNGKRLEVSGQKDLSKALIISKTATDIPQTKTNLMRILSKAHGMRVTGCSTLNLCMVAHGAADCYFDFGPHIWDMCAGELIVREAGGVVMDPSGGKIDIMSRRLLTAATPELATQVKNLIVQIYPTPRDDEQPNNGK